jgi:hypothetical protein
MLCDGRYKRKREGRKKERAKEREKKVAMH